MYEHSLLIIGMHILELTTLLPSCLTCRPKATLLNRQALNGLTFCCCGSCLRCHWDHQSLFLMWKPMMMAEGFLFAQSRPSYLCIHLLQLLPYTMISNAIMRNTLKSVMAGKRKICMIKHLPWCFCYGRWSWLTQSPAHQHRNCCVICFCIAWRKRSLWDSYLSANFLNECLNMAIQSVARLVWYYFSSVWKSIKACHCLTSLVFMQLYSIQPSAPLRLLIKRHVKGGAPDKCALYLCSCIIQLYD